MSDYTPTTEVVRDLYDWAATEKCLPGTAYDEHRAHFDRWLAAHDREVAARTLRELHAEMSEWDGYDTRDIGWAYLATAVLDHIDEKRAEIEKGEVDV